MVIIERRGKRDKDVVVAAQRQQLQLQLPVVKKRNTNDTPSGGMVVLLPSFIGMIILICSIMAKLGFRGRATMCGIDLGTTNSVICIQEQAGTTGSSGGGGGKLLLSSFISSLSSSTDTTTTTNNNHNNIIIHCIADPATGSPVVPSVVSFLDNNDRQRIVSTSSSNTNRKMMFHTHHNLQPDPSHVIVGQIAKHRIDTHPHHTLYHAKRVLGRPSYDPAINTLQNEVEFGIYNHTTTSDNNNDDQGVEFRVPDTNIPITPRMVGSYIVHHLLQMTVTVLGHTNIKSAVICVPAKFNPQQRYETVMAFRTAGITVARIIEEPTAAALAYGLHRKSGVDYILVYDFGGGTLDISLLHVSDGYVDVMGSDGDDRLGGSDFDDVIANFLLYDRDGIDRVQTIHTILQQIQQQDSAAAAAAASPSQQQQQPITDLEDVLFHQCPILNDTPLCTISSYHTLGEQLKIQLSEKYHPDNDKVPISVSTQCLGLPNSTNVTAMMQQHQQPQQWTIERFCSTLEYVPLTLTSTEFNRISQPLFDRSILPIRRLLHDMNMQSSSSTTNNNNNNNEIQEIVMVGGTTRMPQIRQLVQQTFPHSQMNVHIDPDLTVAYGAASVID